MRVALVEFNTWHGECLTPQLAYMKAGGIDATLICPHKTAQAVDTETMAGVCHIECREEKGARNVWEARRAIASSGFDLVVLNTAQGSEALKLSLLPFAKSLRFAGVIHDLRKLTTSTGQQLICRRMSGYLVAARYLTDCFPLRRPVEYFSPLPARRERACAGPAKAAGETWVVVPGNVEKKRRDYACLPRLARALAGSGVRIVVLGNIGKGDGPWLRGLVRSAGLDSMFVFFDQFIPEDVYDSYMRQCDYLLPLIDSDVPRAEDYTRFKTSGTFNLAKAYGKTMLCDNALRQLDGSGLPCLFYDDANELRQHIEARRRAATVPLDFDAEARRYCSFLRRMAR